MLGWVKQRFEDLIASDEAMSLTPPDGSAKILSLKDIKGEVRVSTVVSLLVSSAALVTHPVDLHYDAAGLRFQEKRNEALRNVRPHSNAEVVGNSRRDGGAAVVRAESFFQNFPFSAVATETSPSHEPVFPAHPCLDPSSLEHICSRFRCTAFLAAAEASSGSPHPAFPFARMRTGNWGAQSHRVQL